MNFFDKITLKISTRFFIKQGYLLQFETTPITTEKMSKHLERKGFVQNTNGWFIKGFVYVRFLNDCFEIKTISHKGKSIYISHGENTFDCYMKYLSKFLK